MILTGTDTGNNRERKITLAATIYDIAKHAGVSKSTVSRVLNNQANISEESRKKSTSSD